MNRSVIVLVMVSVGAIVALLIARPGVEYFVSKTPTALFMDALRDNMRTFLRHLVTYHPGDIRTQKLMATYSGALVNTDEFPRRTIRGSFSKETGIMKLRVSDPDLSDAQVRAVLLHELAHTSGYEHDVEWRDTFLFFCNVATRELGWDVNLSQPHNCRAHAICSAGMCALCGFEDQRKHTVTRGKDYRDRWSAAGREVGTAWDRALGEFVKSVRRRSGTSGSARPGRPRE